MKPLGEGLSSWLLQANAYIQGKLRSGILLQALPPVYLPGAPNIYDLTDDFFGSVVNPAEPQAITFESGATGDWLIYFFSNEEEFALHRVLARSYGADIETAAFEAAIRQFDALLNVDTEKDFANPEMFGGPVKGEFEDDPEYANFGHYSVHVPSLPTGQRGRAKAKQAALHGCLDDDGFPDPEYAKLIDNAFKIIDAMRRMQSEHEKRAGSDAAMLRTR